jgi:methionyl-tRNA formyltransferase
MNITIICDNQQHPINSYLNQWIQENRQHNINLVRKTSEFIGGDILFIVSCSQIISRQHRDKYQSSLVLHASDLPKGRGWNPHIWSIIEGKTEIVVTLLEADDKVDTGKIWHKLHVHIPKHALYDEINSAVFDAEMKLMSFAVNNFNSVTPVEQNESVGATYYRLRNPEDSQISANQSIAEQFDIIRVADPQRYPTYFILHGKRYYLKIVKDKSEL